MRPAREISRLSHFLKLCTVWSYIFKKFSLNNAEKVLVIVTPKYLKEFETLKGWE